MSPTTNESKKKADPPDVIILPAGPVTPPKRETPPPTRFPRLPDLGERALVAMTPAARARYQEEKAHQDVWGHLPPQVHQHLRGVELPPQAVEHHAREAGTDPVHFAAGRAYHCWALGQEMPREQYDAAVARVLSEPHGL